MYDSMPNNPNPRSTVYTVATQRGTRRRPNEGLARAGSRQIMSTKGVEGLREIDEGEK